MTYSARLVFEALADSTRRMLIERLSEEGARTATQLASQLPITRQGVTKHLSMLEEAGLVVAEKAGRERRYTFTPEPLNETVSWVEAVTATWDNRLQRLQDYLLGEGPENDEVD